MRRSYLIQAGWAAAVLCFPIEAARAQGGWVVVDAPHTRVHTNAPPQAAVALAELAEATYQAFAAGFPFAPPPATRVEVLAFADEGAFAPYRPNLYSPAYYTNGTGGDRIVLRLDVAAAAAHYRHEYVHLLLRRAGLRLPPLLEEGIAEAWPDAEFARRLRRTAQIGLPRAAAILERGNEEAGPVSMRAASQRYAQAAALAHMLMFDERLAPGFGNLLALLTDGVDAGAAVRTVYGLGLDDLDALLAEHCRRRNFPARGFPAPQGARLELTVREDEDAAGELAFLRQRLDELRGPGIRIPGWMPATVVRFLNAPGY